MKRRGILWFAVAVATVGVLFALSGGCVQQESRVPDVKDAGIMAAGGNPGRSPQPTSSPGQAGTTLSANKTATGFWEKKITYNWTVDKSVKEIRVYNNTEPLKTIQNPEEGSSITLQKGQWAEIDYVIQAIRTKASEEDVYGVRGEITVTNGGDRATENLKLVDQVEYKTGAGQFQPLSGASQTITPSAQLGPGESRTYNYEVTFTPISGASYRKRVWTRTKGGFQPPRSADNFRN